MRVLVALIAFGAATVAAASGGPLAAPLSPASAAPISGAGATGLLRRGGGRASASASARSPPLQLRGGGKGSLAEFRDVVVGAKKVRRLLLLRVSPACRPACRDVYFRTPNHLHQLPYPC